MSKENYIAMAGLWVGVLLIAIGQSNNISSYFGAKQKTIPQVEQVQQGYIAPSKLEIFCKDLDGDGNPETLMRVGDRDYLLREVDGKPVLSAYEIKPAEVVPKE